MKRIMNFKNKTQLPKVKMNSATIEICLIKCITLIMGDWNFNDWNLNVKNFKTAFEINKKCHSSFGINEINHMVIILFEFCNFIRALSGQCIFCC